jgi:hypothetical protein
MKPTIHQRRAQRKGAASVEDILILPDGRILSHNLSPRMAALLRELAPSDAAMRQPASHDTNEISQ